MRDKGTLSFSGLKTLAEPQSGEGDLIKFYIIRKLHMGSDILKSYATPHSNDYWLVTLTSSLYRSAMNVCKVLPKELSLTGFTTPELEKMSSVSTPPSTFCANKNQYALVIHVHCPGTL